jgi:hypothetical protein
LLERLALNPFVEELLALLSESDFSTSSGRPNLAAFARELNGVHYETLRRVVVGERPASLRLISEATRALRLPADYFIEYRLLAIGRSLDFRAVGLERAIENLQRLLGRPGPNPVTDDALGEWPEDGAASPAALEEVHRLIAEALADRGRATEKNPRNR